MNEEGVERGLVMIPTSVVVGNIWFMVADVADRDYTS